MIIHFEDKDYDFDIDNLDINQARFMKRQLGLTIKGFRDGLQELDPDAIVGLYWLIMSQNGRAVDVNKVNFRVAALAEAFTAAAREDEENPTQPTPEGIELPEPSPTQ